MRECSVFRVPTAVPVVGRRVAVGPAEFGGILVVLERAYGALPWARPAHPIRRSRWRPPALARKPPLRKNLALCDGCPWRGKARAGQRSGRESSVRKRGSEDEQNLDYEQGQGGGPPILAVHLRCPPFSRKEPSPVMLLLECRENFVLFCERVSSDRAGHFR